MLKRSSLFIAILLVSLITSNTTINASSGKLKGDSIVWCGGQAYGKHGKDNHWHYAVEHENGWYPDGEPLGYDNPCASQESADTPSDDTSPAAYVAPVSTPVEPEQSNEEKEAEEARIKAEEAERILRGSTLLESVFIGTENITDNIYELKTVVLDYKYIKDNKLVVKTLNDKATYTFNYTNEVKPFEKNTLNLNITSEDTLYTQEYNVAVFTLGEAKDLKDKKASFTVGKMTFDLAESTILTSNDISELTNSSTGTLVINGFSMDDVDYTLNTSNEPFSLTVHYKTLLLDVPVEKKPENDIVNIVIGLTFIVLVSAGIFKAIQMIKKKLSH